MTKAARRISADVSIHLVLIYTLPHYGLLTSLVLKLAATHSGAARYSVSARRMLSLRLLGTGSALCVPSFEVQCRGETVGLAVMH